MAQTFVRRMIQEKGLMEDTFTIEMNGTMHFFEVAAIIDLVEEAPEHEYETIKNTLSQIDFMNGDVMDYIKHLGKALASQYQF